jgi:hypothetical protein
MDGISFRYPIECDLLNSHPLGVFSWALLGQPSCADIRARESFKLAAGMMIWDDFENFARSLQPIKLGDPGETTGIEDWPTLQSRVSKLDASLADVRSKESSLQDAVKRLEEFQARGVSACASFAQDVLAGVLKAGKKPAMDLIKGLVQSSEGKG